MEEAPFESGVWRYDAEEHEVADHLGRRALRLVNGHATLADAAFSDGIVQFDVALTPDRAFTGCTWRRRGDDFEWFWVRPHQSGNPDATQYTPAFNGISGWQLYHGPHYTAPVSLPFGVWMTVRVLFAGSVAEIYVGDLDRPALFVDDLKHEPRAGMVGVSASLAPGWFSRFMFEESPAPPIQGRPAPPEPPVEEAIRMWAVSDPFPEDELDLGTLEEHSWTILGAEPSGLADLARVNGLDDRDTVFARATIVSERAQTKRLDFGFSDRVTVFVNGQPLFSGSDGYRSRDYRFLGSIGWWDSVYLPLRPGRNDLVLAVSEDFGGWGVQAKLADLDGCSVEAPA